MSDELHQRWQTFRQKIRAQFDQLMREATAGCLDLLDLSALDPTAMTNAWSGIRAEVHALGQRIDTVWDDKVEPAFRAAGLGEDEIDRAQALGRELDAALDLEVEAQEIELFAAAADRILAAARVEMARDFGCTQCGAKLELPPQVFRAVNVTCAFCGSVNTHEPGTRVRQVEHFCAHHLSQRAALREWRALRDLERQRRGLRGERIDNLRALEQSWRRYWEVYFRARAALVPAYAPDLQRDVDGRMRAFYDEMARNATWLAHQR